MTKMPLAILAAALASLLLLTACDRRPPHGTVRADAAWVRLPAAKGRPGAAYFRLEAGSEGTRLLAVSSPLVRRIELHQTMMSGTRASMKRRKDVEFPSRGELVFEPAGRHAMLFGINPSVKPGAKIPLTFSFNVAPPITVEAEVRRPADEGPHEGH
ncbi:MAG TPA: copper chaperone PCu(A)C [Allosphingosinicella sp.]|nr:copper chaperone PCu(A)C [Allosphingosinicella sp.]